MSEEELKAFIALLDTGNYHVISMVEHIRRIIVLLLKNELEKRYFVKQDGK